MDNKLIKKDKIFKLEITENLEKKIRFLCARFPKNEWSGVLFYDYTGKFDDDSLKLIAKDFLLMDYGSHTYTEFEQNPEIINYMIENDLLNCQVGLLHSHDTMATFFSGTDTNTLLQEGSFRNNFLSLIVNNAGVYTAAITRKVHHIPYVNEKVCYEFFGEGTVKLPDESYEAEEYDEIEYYMLEIIKPNVNIPNIELFNRINEISSNKASNNNIPSSNIIPTIPSKPFNNGKPFNATQFSFDNYIDNDNKIKPFNNISSNSAVDDDLPPIDYKNYRFNDDVINNIVRQLLLGSPIFKIKTPLNEWIDKMPDIMSKRFGEGSKGLKNYKDFISSFIEYLLAEAWSDDLLDAGVFDDDQMAICAYDVLEKLHTFKKNSFLDIIEDEVSKFII